MSAAKARRPGTVKKRRPISSYDGSSSIKRVLLMDDEEMLRDMGALMIERLGYECETAADGDEAIRAYAEAISSGRPFDGVMLDLTIKEGMGGRETISALIKMDPDVRAIVCSGYCVDPILENFKDYGFSGALPKPYQRVELKKILTAILGGR